MAFVASAKAQTSAPVIMHLKSGIELRGHITKNYSDGNIEIKTESGDVFVYRQNEILRITVDKEAKKREQEIQRHGREREAELARQRAQEAEQSKVVVTPLFTAEYWNTTATKAFQKRNYLEAVDCWSKAVEMGDALSMNNLGYCYEMGYGVVQDEQKAVELYRQSAQLGNTFAEGNLRRLKLIE